mgnify:CR=1 FL=1
MPDEEHEYGLVMPFVAVKSKGGPYDDQAYAAGWEMGVLSAKLASSPLGHSTTIRTDHAEQADLLAMRYGYRCEATRSEEWPEWTYVVFRRGPSKVIDGG